MDGATAGTTGTINVGTVDIHLNEAATEDRLANTVVNLSGKSTDGAEITLGETTYTIKPGADSTVADGTANVVDLSAYDGTETDFNAIAASALTAAAAGNTPSPWARVLPPVPSPSSS